ncbi:DeoR/GlpR family DNA-binding transcription regulator [Pelagibius sp. Alg239-R121]|uniref:DeoR/GlpR family DNA-binding transcription regulator n=1 Tax=Pelagibius sp. Alg239-R121 TaxID=2993448 RepID=UPI0024A7161C|nr:DeoR/GlpR family DNA-binding transcription regulator [Pelagibius sp. Alg239-R121]
MKSSERREAILDHVRRRGVGVVETLAKEFDVSTQTVRRDIAELCEAELLVRHHGGVGLPSSVINTDYALRKISHLEEKEAIGRAVAEYLPDNSSVFMTIGTTMEVVARKLVDRDGLRVITNNLHAATVLHTRPNIDTLVAGGNIRHHNGGIVGTAALDFVEQFRADFAIVGVGAIDIDGTLLDYDYNETMVAQTMMRNARRVVVAADHTKFGRTASVKIGNMSDVTAIFTDSMPAPAMQNVLADCSVEIMLSQDH